MNRPGLAHHSVLVFKLLCILLIVNLIFIVDIPGAARHATLPAEEDPGSRESPLPGIEDTETPEPTRPVISPIPTQYPTEKPNTPEPSKEPDRTDSPDPSKVPEETSTPGPSKEPDNTGQPAETDDPDIEVVEAVSQREMNKLYGSRKDKVAYLTFDDGPTAAYTNKILDILAEENVKATFFLIGTQAEQYPQIVRRQYAEGHGIGNHTYTHVFKRIYESPDNFLEELYMMESLLQSILNTDRKFRLVRFPGGSFGEKLAQYRDRINEEGFVYIDWNCVNGDAETTEYQKPQQLLNRVKETAKGKSSLIVLMHDSLGKQTTVDVLPQIIEHLRSEGYRFELLPGSRGY